MKNNKKFLIGIVSLIVIVLLIAVYIYYIREDSNSFTVSERNWLSENRNIRENFEIISDYPIYGEDGVFNDFIESLEDATNLEFNVIPYYKSIKTTSNDYKFKIVKEYNDIKSNDILLNEDVYVVIGKSEEKLNEIRDFENLVLGVFNDDVGDISYYLKSGRNLTYKTYDDSTKLFSALDADEVDMIVVPNIMFLDKIIVNDNYYINYVLTEMSNKIVLSLKDNNSKLNNIIKKHFQNWTEKSFVEKYNKKLLDYYVEKNKINDKTKSNILSKTYTYGFVENYPYEALVRGNFVGISAEYVNRIMRLSNIEFEFKKYKTVNELKTAANNKEIDMFFNYYNWDIDSYKKTTSPFIEKYSVLGNLSDYNIVNSFESMRGKKIKVMHDTALYSFFKNNSKANISTVKNIKQLSKQEQGKLIVVDNETYNYYRNTKFKKYELLYTDTMTNDYNFMIKDSNSDFYDLFNYIITTNSYYNYRNNGLNSLDVSILNQKTFKGLYFSLIIIIVSPVLLGFIAFNIYKKRKAVKTLKKEERKKYTDMLTSLKNRNYLNFNINNWNASKKYPQAIVIIDLNNINYVNENYGYKKGDNLIVKAAGLLVNTQLEKSEIIRTDGNEFLIYLVGYSEQQISAYTKKLSKELKTLPYGFGAAIGYSMIIDDIKTIDDAINEATLDMRNDKEGYK